VNEELLLQLDGISMHYGKGETAVTALAGVDLTVHAGELVAVMGASGSGKSTMLTIAGGLTTLRHRMLGFLFRDFNPTLTAIHQWSATRITTVRIEALR
jgi:putative ABC transport system ATP-binding protein